MLCQLGSRLSRHTCQGDDIILSRRRVIAVVVQIKVDMVGILTDHTAGELAILQFQRIAGVILQGDIGRSRLILI